MLDFPKWKVWSIWALLAVLCALAVPSLIPESAAPSWLARASRINLGLDLAGGSYLLLEADTQDLANTRIESMRDNIQGQMRNGTPRIDFLVEDLAIQAQAASRIDELNRESQ